MEDANLKWATLSSTYVFNDNWLKARADRCQRHDGKIVAPYYVMEYPDWVAGVGLTVDQQVVLVTQYRHAIGEVCLELPGGCVDKTDPDFEYAMRREFAEETGYHFEAAHYLGRTSANPSTNSNLMHMFLLTGGTRQQEQQLDANEEIIVSTVPLADFKALVRQNAFLQSMHVTAILFALLKLDELKL